MLAFDKESLESLGSFEQGLALAPVGFPSFPRNRFEAITAPIADLNFFAPGDTGCDADCDAPADAAGTVLIYTPLGFIASGGVNVGWGSLTTLIAMEIAA